MTNDEIIDRNIDITFDFLRYLVDNPDIIEKIPDGAEIDVIDNNMPLNEKYQLKKKKIVSYKVKHIFEAI